MILRNTLLLLMLVTISLSIAQDDKKIDSLLNKYNQLDDGIPKIKTLEHLYYAEIYNRPERGLEYARKSLALSSRLNNWSGVGVAYYHIGVYYKLTSVLDSARYYYNKSLDIWKKHPDTKLHATTLSGIASLESETGNIDRGIEIQRKVVEITGNNGFGLKHGVGLAYLGDMYLNKGNYELAYRFTVDAIRVLDTIVEEPWRDADAQRQLGNIEYLRGNYDRALEHYNNALKVYKETDDNIYAGHTYVDLGSVAHELERFDEAIAYYNKGLEYSKSTGAIDMKANSLSNLGMVYSTMNEHDVAYKYLEEAIQLNRAHNSKSNLVNSLGEMGNVNRKLGKDDEALKYLNEAIRISDSIGALDLKKMAIRYRSQAYIDSEKYIEAVPDLQLFQVLNDSLFNKEKSRQIEELKTIYETEKKEAEIALQQEEIKTLNAKAEVDKLTKGLYAGGMASALALSGLLVFGFRQRIKKNRIAREKQEEIYRKEIEHKKKELTSQTLHLVQKNTFIQELMENLENLRNSPERFKMEFRRIVMLLKKENASDKDWEVFKTYFAEVHNDFDQKLKAFSPEISEKEIRLAAFLRMNLTTKEIAATMNVLPDSILKSKYRLKKKLELPRGTDLTDFLNSL